MQKNFRFYDSLRRATLNYIDRHDTVLDCPAVAIGFRGENAGKQLSKHLNPSSESRLNSGKFNDLLDVLDHEARMEFLRNWMMQWGIKPVPITPDPDPTEIGVMADRAQIEGSESWLAVKVSLDDGELDDRELANIRKETIEAINAYEALLLQVDKEIQERREM